MAEEDKSDREPLALLRYLSELHEPFKTKTSNVDFQERKTMSDSNAEKKICVQ
jgi:hypothetical protein